MRVNKFSQRAIALTSTMLFLALLLTMVLALFTAVRHELFVSQNYRDGVAAKYLAEIAVADALRELALDPEWDQGFAQKTQPNLNGHYTVEFNQGGPPFSKLHSVNNLDGSHDENYRGAGFVPTRHVSLVVMAQVGRQTELVETMVQIGGSVYHTDLGIASTGRIMMHGDVAVGGQAGLNDPSPVEAGIHSNYIANVSDVVTWDGSGNAAILGQVSTASAHPAAIDLSGYTPSAGAQVNAGLEPIESVDILGTIQQQQSSPGIGSIASVGVTTVSPVAGSHDIYHSGNLELNGDLVLDDVTLYVDGELDVNGSVTGNGSIYVAKSSRFQGDSKVLASTPERVALFSEGNVRIQGFDGTAYMDSLANTDPQLAAYWNETKQDFQDFKDRFLALEPGDIGADVDPLLRQLSDGAGNLPPGEQGQLFVELKNAMDPNDSAGQFLQERFQHFEELFHSEQGDGTPAALDSVLQGQIQRGSFDAVLDSRANDTAVDPNRYDDHMDVLKSFLKTTEFDRLGSAYFQGLVYTHGSVVTEAEVTIVGALVAHGDPAGDEVTVNLDPVYPGDLYLSDRTNVQFIEDFFAPDSAQYVGGPQGANVVLWMPR